jgi:PAS domain S-box-containing protein
VITWVDITGRLAAEAQSRHLSAVLRDSNDAVILLDLKGNIIGWNRGAERVYGYGETDAVKKNILDLIPASHRAPVADLVQRLAADAAVSESLDSLRNTKDNRTRDVWMTMTLLRSETGQPDGIVTTERDVTEVKDGLAAAEAARLYKLVVEQLPAGAVLREGDRLLLNRAAETLTGYARPDLPTVDAWCAALHGPDASLMRPRYEATPPPEDGANLDFVIARKDGQVRHITVSICRLDDSHALWMLLDAAKTTCRPSSAQLPML